VPATAIFLEHRLWTKGQCTTGAQADTVTGGSQHPAKKSNFLIF